MLRAHAIRSLFDENMEDDCKGFILTTSNGMLQGSNTTLPESAAKRASALCALTWRSHVDTNFHKSSAGSFATHAVEAVAIRRKQSGDTSSILLTIADKDGRRAAEQPLRIRLWAVAPVKDRMLVAVGGAMVVSQDDVGEAEKLVLVNKAEGMAEHLRGELRGFTMPGGAVERIL